MTSVPFAVVAIGAFLIYLWYKRSRESEALPEYGAALLQLAWQREAAGEPERVVEHIRAMGNAVSAVAGSSIKSMAHERKTEVHRLLLSASSPFLLEEAGLIPGTPRFIHTKSAVSRKLGELGR
jgi:hypothetical protein